MRVYQQATALHLYGVTRCAQFGTHLRVVVSGSRTRSWNSGLTLLIYFFSKVVAFEGYFREDLSKPKRVKDGFVDMDLIASLLSTKPEKGWGKL